MVPEVTHEQRKSFMMFNSYPIITYCLMKIQLLSNIRKWGGYATGTEYIMNWIEDNFS